MDNFTLNHGITEQEFNTLLDILGRYNKHLLSTSPLLPLTASAKTAIWDHIYSLLDMVADFSDGQDTDWVLEQVLLATFKGIMD